MNAVDITIPVYNEEEVLVRSVQRLNHFLVTNFPYPYQITIVDNASTDNTWALARMLQTQYATVRAIHLDQKGRGRALKTAWRTSDARVRAYMDVDLSTDLNALLPLITPLLSGHSDVAIGSRLNRNSRVVRSFKREFISRSYNFILRTALRARFSDAQCGFKAITAEVADTLLPWIEDNNWFFDTELLVQAQRSDLRIHEVPVDWIEDTDSRVHLVATAVEDLKGVARLQRDAFTHHTPTHNLRQQIGRHRSCPQPQVAAIGSQTRQKVAQ